MFCQGHEVRYTCHRIECCLVIIHSLIKYYIGYFLPIKVGKTCLDKKENNTDQATVMAGVVSLE